MSDKKYLLAGKVTVFIEIDMDSDNTPKKEALVDLVEGDLQGLGYDINKVKVQNFTVNEIEEG